MTRRLLCLPLVVLFVACSAKLQRPDVPPSRTLEPSFAQGAGAPVDPADGATALFIAGVQSQVGRRLMHARDGGEVIEDAVWSWSAPPDRYLETALHLAAAADPRLLTEKKAAYEAEPTAALARSLEVSA